MEGIQRESGAIKLQLTGYYVYFIAMIHLFRIIGIFIWLGLSSVYGLLLTPFFWRNRKLNRHLARVISWGIIKICGIEVVVHGRENLDIAGPAIFVGNHQHELDVAVYGRFIPDGIMLTAKRQMVWIPFFGVLWYAAGNIFINREKRNKALQQIGEVARTIQDEKVTTLIFPEGTRNKALQGVLPFKKGPFYLALEISAPIVPIIVSPYKPLFGESKKLHSRGRVHVSILPPIDITAYDKDDVAKLLEDIREVFLQEADTYQTEILS